MKIGKEFNQDDWERKFDRFEIKYRPAFMQVLKAVLAGTVVGLVLLYCGVSVGSALSLPVATEHVGSSWIAWGWNFDNATVYVDGTLINLDSDLGFYILSDLDGTSRHRIDVYDNDDLMQHYFCETTTLMSIPVIFLIIGFVIACICLGVIIAYMPIVGFLPATGLLMYLIVNNFEGWLILFVAFLWLGCLIYGVERLGKSFSNALRGVKRK